MFKISGVILSFLLIACNPAQREQKTAPAELAFEDSLRYDNAIDKKKSTEKPSGPEKVVKIVQTPFSIDSILGDKVLDVKTKKIRSNNFDKLVGISIHELKSNSGVYLLKQLDANYYLLQQKKSYEVARQFNLLLRCEDNKVASYFVLNDFTVRDYKADTDGWLLLCCDWDNRNLYWQSKQQVMVLKLDRNFNTVWKYSADDITYPLDAVKIEPAGEQVCFIVNVVTGCHICYSTVKLVLTNQGKFQSVTEVALQHSIPVDKAVLKKIFKG